MFNFVSKSSRLTSVGHWLFGFEQISLYDDNEKQNSTGYLISCNAASFSQFVGSFWSIQDQPACRHSLPTEFKRNCYKLLNFQQLLDSTYKEMIEKKWTIPGNFQLFPGNSSLPLISTLNSSLTFIKAMSTCEYFSLLELDNLSRTSFVSYNTKTIFYSGNCSHGQKQATAYSPSYMSFLGSAEHGWE